MKVSTSTCKASTQFGNDCDQEAAAKKELHAPSTPTIYLTRTYLSGRPVNHFHGAAGEVDEDPFARRYAPGVALASAVWPIC